MAKAVEKLQTPALEAERDKAETAGDWPRFERCEAELERRESDESDPAAVAHREETERDTPALDLPWWEYR